MGHFRPTRDSDLGVRLINVLQQALRERRLDVAEALLQAVEIYDADRTAKAAYLVVAELAADAPQPAPKRRPHGI